MSGAAVGRRLGPYELQTVVGAGGMGEVWKARDTRLDRTVAIKFSQTEFSDRFAREAHAIAALNHPHISTLYDVGPNYLVMEYIDGKPLAGPLPLPDALALAIQIADGLDAAHTKGIVHRDLKPANILVTKAGIKLLDFGLAKHSRRSSVPGDLTLTQAITGAGTIVGTLHYMSPEQAEAKEVDHRSDIFSFGCVLYEVITGKKPFDGGSPASVIASILTADPAPLALAQPLAPPALERVVQHCLEKDPDQRWQSVRDLRRELKWIAETGSKIPVLGKPKGRSPSVIAAISATVLATAATAAGLWLWLSREPQPVRQVVRFGLNAADATSPAISPDGRHIVYIAGKNRSLWVQDLDENEPRSIEGTGGAQGAFWSPDSAFIAFARGAELMKTPVAGGTQMSICGLTNAGSFSGSWSPDGEWIVFGSRGGGGIYRVAARGGTPSLVIPKSSELQEPRNPYFLPLPSKRAAFLFITNGLKDGARTWIHNVNTGTQHPLGGADGYSPTYSRSGHILYLRSQIGVQLWAAPFSIETQQITGESFPVADSRTGFGVSNNDTLVYLERSAAMRELAVRDRAGRKTAVIGAPAQELRYPVLSPDGTRVTFSAAEEFSHNIWIAEVHRPVKTRVTFTPADSRQVGFYDYPAWSPAGDRIAYFAFVPPQQYSIRSKAADGSGAEVELVKSSVFIALSQWYMPDRMLLYRREPQSMHTRLDFVSIPSSGTDTDSRKPNVPPYSEHGARVSPNGTFLALVSSQSGRDEVYVRFVNQSTGGKQVSERGGNQPRWRSDGKELYYAEGNSIMAVSVSSSGSSITLGKPQLLFTIQRALQWGYGVWPDGQRFLMPEPVEGSKPPSIRVVQNWSAAFGPKPTD